MYSPPNIGLIVVWHLVVSRQLLELLVLREPIVVDLAVRLEVAEQGVDLVFDSILAACARRSSSSTARWPRRRRQYERWRLPSSIESA